MADLNHREDRQTDENLRRIGARLDLPAPPTAAQRARWKASAVPGESLTVSTPPPASLQNNRPFAFHRGANFMRKYGVFTMAGSAAAAVLVFCAFLLHPAGPATVQAKMILDNLKSSPHKGLRIQCKDIAAEGALVNARITVLFDKPLNLAQLMDENNQEEPPIQAVYLDADIICDETNADAPGLRIAAKGAFTETEQWIYARIDRLPAEMLREAPFLYFFQNMLQAGILLDLQGLDDLRKDLGIFSQDDADDADDDDDEDNDEDIRVVTTHRSVVRVNGDPQTSDKDDEDAAPDGIESVLNEKTLKDLLTGSAGREQLDQLVAALEKEAKQASVKETEPGLFILTASGFEDADDEMTKNAMVEIAYRKGMGVEWLRVENLGEKHGFVRVEFIDEPVAADHLSKAAFLNDGATRVFDMQALMKMAEPFIQPGQPASEKPEKK